MPETFMVKAVEERRESVDTIDYEDLTPDQYIAIADADNEEFSFDMRDADDSIDTIMAEYDDMIDSTMGVIGETDDNLLVEDYHFSSKGAMSSHPERRLPFWDELIGELMAVHNPSYISQLISETEANNSMSMSRMNSTSLRVFSIFRQRF
jgi:hypothetical protein